MIKKLHEFAEMKHSIVFDFDRTLAKIEIDWSQWHADIAKIFSAYNSSHEYKQGINPHIFLNQMVKQYGAPLLTEVRNFNRAYESKYVTGFTPNVELVDFVQANTSHTLFVYSSNARATVLRGLHELGIVESFEMIITQDEVEYLKPDPEGLYLIEGFAEDKQSFLMVGDSGSDRGAASAAGIDFLECSLFEKYLEEEVVLP